MDIKKTKANTVEFEIKQKETFTLEQFLIKAKFKEIFDCKNEKDIAYLKRFAESTLYFFMKQGLIEKIDQISNGKKGRPKIVYRALKDISFKIGEDIKINN